MDTKISLFHAEIGRQLGCNFQIFSSHTEDNLYHKRYRILMSYYGRTLFVDVSSYPLPFGCSIKAFLFFKIISVTLSNFKFHFPSRKFQEHCTQDILFCFSRLVAHVPLISKHWNCIVFAAADTNMLPLTGGAERYFLAELFHQAVP